MNAARFLLVAVALTPAVVVASTLAVSWWYERVFLPRISGISADD